MPYVKPMNNDEFHELLSGMPALRHSVPGEEFTIEKSEALAWVLAQPCVKVWLWDRIRNTGRIEFDQATGRWRGVPRGPVGRPRQKVSAEASGGTPESLD